VRRTLLLGTLVGTALALIPAPAWAHGGVGGGADNVATFLAAGALAMGAWFLRLRRRPGLAGWRRWARRVLPVLAVAAIAGAVTSGSWVPAAKPSRVRPTTTARLQILSPTPGQVTGPNLVVRLQLTGGKVAPPAAFQNALTQGHIHISVDGLLVSMAYGLQQEVDGLTPGSHLVRAEFVAVDHAPFRVPVVATVPIVVRGPGA